MVSIIGLYYCIMTRGGLKILSNIKDGAFCKNSQ